MMDEFHLASGSCYHAGWFSVTLAVVYMDPWIQSYCLYYYNNSCVFSAMKSQKCVLIQRRALISKLWKHLCGWVRRAFKVTILILRSLPRETFMFNIWLYLSWKAWFMRHSLELKLCPNFLTHTHTHTRTRCSLTHKI